MGSLVYVVFDEHGDVYAVCLNEDKADEIVNRINGSYVTVLLIES